ncbi:hypothetical protein PoB_000179400 [Plakobranchus ocellatus]|uniref:Uncharacterized protein n=1 Tax=Plakobranchus ocellatus TaxID=259542 RepID=A0AAV3XZC2_9GAST|nr:hypothetical protein PoB_000179400 [Plakobranchus ocellatus]
MAPMKLTKVWIPAISTLGLVATQIMFSLDTGDQRTTNEPQYIAVFGKSPPSGLFSGASHLIKEEDLPEEEQEESYQHRPVFAPRTTLTQLNEADVRKSSQQRSFSARRTNLTQLNEDDVGKSNQKKPIPARRITLTQQQYLDPDTESPPTDLYVDDGAISEED